MGPVKILIIDDEKDFVEMLGSYLGDKGYEIVKAFDGEDGIQKAKSERPGIVVCDIRMPAKDGFDVLREVRRETPLMPFIIVSALSDLDYVRKAYDSTADFYVTKPVSLEMLGRNIATLLSITHAREIPR